MVSYEKRQFSQPNNHSKTNKAETSSDAEHETDKQKQSDDPDFDDKKARDEQEYYSEEEEKQEFKTHRKVMFAVGKAIKYTLWAAFALFCYHMYLVIYADKPEEGLIANHHFLEAAKFVHWSYGDLKILLTRPPVESLLLPRPPLPPGYAPMKTLVLNLNGTLIHSEYKFGTGFEVLKRPGLSVFLQRMARNYEIVIFGDQEQGFIHEICEALDP